MTWVASAVAVVGAGTAAWSGHESRKATKKQGELLGNLNYYEDPDYRETQDYLKKYGIDLMDGDIPDYYKGIGESGSQEFEDLLKMTNRDIMTGTEEALAKGGRGRGGALAASTAQAVGDNTAKLRYQDLERALQGKQYLMEQGKVMTENVRSAAQGEGDRQNEFNVNKTRGLIDLEGMKGEQKVQEIGQYGESLSTLIGGMGGGNGGGLLSLFGGGSKTSGAGNLSSKDIELYSSGRSSTGAIRKKSYMNYGKEF